MATEGRGSAAVTRDLLAIQAGALEAVQDYDRYLVDAEDAGLPEVAYFVRQLMQEDLARAGHSAGLLRELGTAGRQQAESAWPSP